MPVTPHVERHFTGGDMVRDIVIGMSDGLTVPFALAAGLSGATDASTIVMTAGLAEVAAGSIAMGLGGFLAARSDAEHFASEKRREEQEVVHVRHLEREEVREVFRAYGIDDAAIEPVVEQLAANPERWVDFMMRFELGLERPDPKRALRSALTIAGAYVALLNAAHTATRSRCPQHPGSEPDQPAHGNRQQQRGNAVSPRQLDRTLAPRVPPGRIQQVGRREAEPAAGFFHARGQGELLREIVVEHPVLPEDGRRVGP